MDHDQKFLLLVEARNEDANVILRMLREVDHQRSFMVEVVETLADGLRIASQADVALIDLTLPDSKGIDTFRSLKCEVNIPIVVVAQQGDDVVGLQAIKEGAQDFLVFGQFTAHTLLRSILYAIERHRREVAESRLSEVLAALGEMRKEFAALVNQMRQCRQAVDQLAGQGAEKEFAGSFSE